MTERPGAPPERTGSEPPRGPRLGPGREFDLIREFVETGAPDRPDVWLGSGDDCAVVDGRAIAASTDFSVEHVHFRREWLDPEAIGYRAAAGALSDLAAMAARPIGIFVSVALSPADAAQDVVRRIGWGARKAAEEADAVLLGGDLSRSPNALILHLAVLGEAAEPVTRSGARAGDSLWVTGRLGGAAAAVHAWNYGAEPSSSAREAFAHPRPRIREARWLASRGVLDAMIDLSDGLAGDAAHLAAASGVAAVIEPERVPIHSAAREVANDEEDALRLALGGGEDYELCFAGPAESIQALADAFRREFDLDLNRVGSVREGSGVHVVRPDGTLAPVEAGAFRHFDGDAT